MGGGPSVASAPRIEICPFLPPSRDELGAVFGYADGGKFDSSQISDALLFNCRWSPHVWEDVMMRHMSQLT